MAFRLGTEMTVATLLGAVMGYALDSFFGTKPWLMVFGVLAGGAAGSLNVYRIGQEIQLNDSDNDNGKEE